MSNLEKEFSQNIPEAEQKLDKETIKEYPETKIETSETFETYIEKIDQAIVAETKDAKSSGVEQIESALTSIGVSYEDIKNAKNEIVPLQEELDRITEEAHSEIQKSSAEVMREQWLESSMEAIETQGLETDPETPAYKSFRPEAGERFLIQKCKNKDGRDVVVKVSAPNEQDRGAIKNEGILYDFLKNQANEAASKGENIEIEFPQKLEEFTHIEQEGLIIGYIENDKEAKKNLTPEERTNLVIKAIKEMQKLPVPTEEAEKPHNERLMEIRKADEYFYRWKYFLPDLVESKTIPEEESKVLMQTIQEDKKLIADLPLRLEHGDIHGDNIAYSVDKTTGDHKITLMDFEALRVSNEFSPLAQIANREEITKQVMQKYQKELSQMPEFKKAFEASFGIFEDTNATQKLEQEFIKNNDDPKNAERVYTIMRIDEVLGGLHRARNKNEGPYRILNEIYRGILEEQMKKLSKEN